jgi:uncharacterized protein (TIGR00251 family)
VPPTDAAPGSPFAPCAEGVRVALRVQPGASRSRIDGPAARDDGRTVLKVRVGAPPEGGKANAAVVALLAKAWKLPKRDLAVVAGARDRNKTLLVRGAPDALMPTLSAWLRALRAEPRKD